MSVVQIPSGSSCKPCLLDGCPMFAPAAPVQTWGTRPGARLAGEREMGGRMTIQGVHDCPSSANERRIREALLCRQLYFGLEFSESLADVPALPGWAHVWRAGPPGLKSDFRPGERSGRTCVYAPGVTAPGWAALDRTWTSTRRFWARPAAVRLVATSTSLPMPMR